MAPYVNFVTLLASRKNELTDLPEEEYLRFGNHVYVLRKEIDITQLLGELADRGTEGGTAPVLHLHLYCQRLSGTLTDDQELKVRVYDRGCTLRSLHIFAAQLPSLKRLVLVGNESADPQAAVQLSLYYETESGPANFWINRTGCAPAAVHHFDLTATGGAGGIRLHGSGPLEAIPSVCWDELRPPRPAEFETFGEDTRRLQNLPRLLNGLFTSAGEELMGPQPNIPSIMAKLRFINLCAREAPNLVGLVNESQTLLSRLELPKGFPTLPAIGGKPFDDCFFVPEKVPRTLESVMDVPMNNLLAISRRLESEKEMQGLRALIREQGGALMTSIGLSVGSTISKARLDDEAEQAAHTTETVMDKMDDLRKYKRDLDSAKASFDKGLNEFKERMEKKLVWDILKAVFEIGASVGIAIYTGGAGAPLTVGAVNKVLKEAAETIEEKTRLVMALKKLATVLITVYPKVNAALQNHSKFSEVGSDKDKRGTKLVDSLKATAGTISDRLLAGKAGERINYLGLLADWREMDICADSAFAAIKEEIKEETIDGLDEYRLAMKKLAIRGETLVTALKESYEARTRYLVLVAEVRAKEAALDEINSLHQKVLGDGSQEPIAFMPIRQRLVSELAQRRRAVFNMLHQGVLALVYHSNDVKLQKRLFGSLSPALTADQLADQWETFKKATIEGKQPQDKDLTVGAAQALPLGWRDLLIKDIETPFQIPPTIKALTYQHHMRIRKIRAEFVGLTKRDGSTDGIDKLEYTIWMGPLMIDRASPYINAPSSKGTVVQYYMEPYPLVKSGKDHELIDDKHDFAKRAVCCSGRLSFRKDYVEEAGWSLETIADVKLNVKYETLIFPS
ncbi:hypothetical protein QBC46DRAFT_359019 [Diplogelasinospora grovesii]|uniref:Uncharacterized protein n=1 Tax=Diplogelasinospora grovesii TaxID=303347 RepID=A0AAN6MVV7_9PEZI|nr:hypothetical protein QBC46DRAFT_359019 [Diplogelasinospora grovesii]